ncbi:hypothetical protein [Streptomyces sp. NPDC047130]|uniref:hypothetical protein n=1 Tax=Streptomyces sp. NPDC047130 TaxID=3155261 RepID=UPI0033E7E9A7
MQGHGHALPQPVPPGRTSPSTGVLVFLRVLFVVIAVGSIGMLLWAPMLRLALVTRRALDWGLFVLSVVLTFVAGALLVTGPDEGENTPAQNWGAALLLITLTAVIAYYLAADIRHFERRRKAPFPGPAYAVPGAAPAGAGYGYPPRTPGPYGYPAVPQQHGTWSGGATPTPVPTRPATGPNGPTMPTMPIPPSTPPATPATPPSGGRIDQVRAELDELSELLRKQDGGPEGGR